MPLRWPAARMFGDPFVEETFLRVRKIVSEQMGVREADIHRGLRFIEDLGMG